MVAAGGLHDVGDLVLAQGGGRVLKLGVHRPRRVAVAVWIAGKARVLAVFLHQLVEKLHDLLAAGERPQLFEQALGLGELFLLRRVVEGVALLVLREHEDVLDGHIALALAPADGVGLRIELARRAVAVDPHALVEQRRLVHEVENAPREHLPGEELLKVLLRAVLAAVVDDGLPHGLIQALAVLVREGVALRRRLHVQRMIGHGVLLGEHLHVVGIGHALRQLGGIVHLAIAGLKAVHIDIEPVEKFVPGDVAAVNGHHHLVGVAAREQRLPVVGGLRARLGRSFRLRRRRCLRLGGGLRALYELHILPSGPAGGEGGEQHGRREQQ